MPDVPLDQSVSASRIKTFKSCSMLYWLKYIMKFPEPKNQGALLGGVVHKILEALAKPKRNGWVQIIRAADDVTTMPVIDRYIKTMAKRFSLTKMSVDKINVFCLVALNQDFFCHGGSMIGQEIKFDIISESPRYHILGYIDMLARYGNFLRVIDFKTQAKTFTKEELTENLQGLIYSLAATKMYPGTVPIVDFWMLNFPDDVQRRLRADPEKLAGFEYYLETVYRTIVTFQPKDAWKNVAATKGFPTDGTFGGLLMCGRCKAPGELKVDGTKKWHCAYRFPYDYYELQDNKGKLLTTAMLKTELRPDVDQKIVKKHFKGCPHFHKKDYVSEFAAPRIQK